MKTITLTEEQYESLMNGNSITINPPKKKWNPEGGMYFINARGDVRNSPSTENFRNFGVEYQTEEQAMIASRAMRKHNRLLAWLAENDDGWVADWTNPVQEKYFVFRIKSTSKWEVECNITDESMGTVYMSESNAEKLCKLLNEGVVEL